MKYQIKQRNILVDETNDIQVARKLIQNTTLHIEYSKKAIKEYSNRKNS